MWIRRIQQFIGLPASDRLLLVRCFLAIGFAELGLRILGFHRLLAWIEHRDVVDCNVTPADLENARRYARGLERVARHHVVRARCLHRSLALHRWLRQRGLPDELVIGVRKESDSLLAHAWIELGSEVVNDTPESVRRYAPLSPASRTRLPRFIQ